ncbi:MAG: hypothetical protein ACLFR7_05730, partial [Opitutales bacterium]
MLRNASVRSAKGLLRARARLAAVVLAVILVGLGGWLLRPSPDLASPPPESAPAVTTEPAAAAADDAGAAAEAAGAVRGHQEDAPVLPGPPEWRALVVALPPEERPERVLGCEVWRGLDWMPDDEKVPLDVSGNLELAQQLNGVFDSQIVGGKRYDLATIGRRRANATFLESHHADAA